MESREKKKGKYQQHNHSTRMNRRIQASLSIRSSSVDSWYHAVRRNVVGLLRRGGLALRWLANTKREKKKFEQLLYRNTQKLLCVKKKGNPRSQVIGAAKERRKTVHRIEAVACQSCERKEAWRKQQEKKDPSRGNRTKTRAKAGQELRRRLEIRRGKALCSAVSRR